MRQCRNPTGGDNCLSGGSVVCNDADCRCYQRIGGAGAICGLASVCVACTQDADCGPGRYCLDGGGGGDCCAGNFCGSLCPVAAPASASAWTTKQLGDA